MRNSNVDNRLTRLGIKETPTSTNQNFLQISQMFPVWFQCGFLHPRIDAYNIEIKYVTYYAYDTGTTSTGDDD
jgi:hypothetical protein